jgi:hypothetical protein
MAETGERDPHTPPVGPASGEPSAGAPEEVPTAYRRVDLAKIEERPAEAVDEAGKAVRIRWMVVPVSLVGCLAQAIVTIILSNVYGRWPTSTMIPVLSFGVLFVLVLGFNPLLRLVNLPFAGRGPRPYVWPVLWTAYFAAALAIGVHWAFGVLLGLVLLGGLAWGLYDAFEREGRSGVRELAWAGGGVLLLAVGIVAARAYGSWTPVLVCLGFLLAATLLFIRSFTKAELVAVFCAMMVTAGVSTYGLTAQLVPIIGAPWNPEWNTPQAGWEENLLPHLNRKLYLDNTEDVRRFREGLNVPEPHESAPWDQRWEYYKRVLEQVPWKLWAGKLFYWLIFVAACYGMFYCITYIVLGYWSDREKLIFPLAKLPEAIVPESDRSTGWVPRIFASPGFWSGFALSFFVLSWNAGVSANLIAGLKAIPLGMSQSGVGDLLSGGSLEGLLWGPQALMFLIVFTCIGIAFLLPLEISFSAWFYFLVGKVMILVACWMGYGQTGSDFPSNWMDLNNAVTAQGAGAMLLFSGISLYRSIREYVRLASGKSPLEKIKIGLPVIGLVVCLLVMTFWLMWNNFSFVWALVAVLFLTLITVGLMRIVAEGGIYWFQSHASFFHSFKMLGLGRYLKGAVAGPFLLVYSVVFLEIKTFLAPMLMNASKLQKDARTGRRRFHLNLVTCLTITVLVSLAFAVYLSYMRGAQQMSGWFYSGGPKSFVDTSYRMAKAPPKFEFGTFMWYIVGAAWLAVSVFLRRTLFWFPHPIGYVMLISRLMANLWFSFFLGWIAKKIVVKYGGKVTFDRVRKIFIGLIMGELIAIFLWYILMMAFGLANVGGLDLNRYGP